MKSFRTIALVVLVALFAATMLVSAKPKDIEVRMADLKATLASPFFTSVTITTTLVGSDGLVSGEILDSQTGVHNLFGVGETGKTILNLVAMAPISTAREVAAHQSIDKNGNPYNTFDDDTIIQLVLFYGLPLE